MKTNIDKYTNIDTDTNDKFREEDINIFFKIPIYYNDKVKKLN